MGGNALVAIAAAVMQAELAMSSPPGVTYTPPWLSCAAEKARPSIWRGCGMSTRMKPLWMPLYVEKFLADTGGLTPSQGGAYIRLLCAMWRSEDGTLPNNDAKLARSAGVGSNNWMRVWPAIKSLFDIDGDR